jgi:ElaB/YqjD/DUF883 family membrane-anchored ribosome-binding protein
MQDFITLGTRLTHHHGSPHHVTVTRKKRVAEHLKETAADSADAADTLAGHIQQFASDTAEQVGQVASDLIERGEEKANEVLERAGEHVQEHPGSSLLIAAGIGFLIGTLMTQK